jgi:hypothetical protein
MLFLILTLSAAFLTGKDERLRALVFCMAGLIAASLLALKFTPDQYWYQICAAFEALIVVGCLIFRPYAAISIAPLSIIAIVWHFAAYVEYSSGIYTNTQLGPVVTEHHLQIPVIQFWQAVSLFLYSPPSLRFIDGKVSAMINGVFNLIKRLKRKPGQGTWQPQNN